MATSGGFVTNQINHSRFYFNWQLTGQDVGANKSNINWQAGLTNNLSGGTDLYYSNAVKIYGVYINGSGNLGSGTWSNITSGGNWGLLSGNIDIYHNGDGSKNFGASMSGWTYNGNNYSGSGGWDLPGIPRYAVLTALSPDSGVPATDVSALWVEFSNPGGFPTTSFVEIINGGSPIRIFTDDNSGSRHTFTTDATSAAAIQTAMANTNTATIRMGVYSTISGSTQYDYRDRTITIENGAGQANPTFAAFTIKDNNSTTTAITGNNQYLIQGNSILEVDISTAQKALAVKNATMVKYNSSVSSYSVDTTYTTSAIAQTIGAIADATNQLLTVRAIDSRGNSTPVTATVNILPYLAPQVLATGVRQNNLEATTTIHIQGLISLLTISGSNKNAVNTASGVKYRYVEHGNSFTGISWNNVTSATNSTTGAITVTDFTLSLDNTKSYDFQVTITDKLNTIEYDFTVSVGIPLMRIGSDGFIYNNEQPMMISHVGMVIMTNALTTAAAVAAKYGGTWVAWAPGRAPLGMGSNGTTTYSTVDATGGEEKHTLTATEMPYFSLSFGHHGDEGGSVIRNLGINNGSLSYGSPGVYRPPNGATSGAGSNSQPGWAFGGNTPHNVMMPWQTIYFWKRTV